MARKETIDFGGVPKEIRRGGGQYNPRVPDGEYEMKIIGQTKKWKDNDKSNPAYFEWRFQISSGEHKGKQPYTYTTSLKPEALFNLRNLINAATGKNVAGKSLNFDPDVLVGKTVGAAVAEEEYNKKITSRIQDVFPADELESDDDEDEDEDEDEEDEEDVEEEDEDDDEEEEPQPKRKKKKKAADEEEDDDLEDIDLDEL